MKLAEFIYTVLLKPKLLRQLANGCIRLVIPSSIHIQGAVVKLNPQDPVVSGALALGVYENDEIRFLASVVRPGMTILDIGANIGLYTALLGKATGPAGRVYAFEPDPESLSFLRKTIAANQFSHVEVVPTAAAAQTGTRRLYTCSQNRGDNRLYENELADGFLDVEVIRIDDYLKSINTNRVDLIKIDVQGFEAEVIAGLEQTIRSSPKLILLSEFWPDGLRQAGADPLKLLQSLQAWGLCLHSLEQDGTTKTIPDFKAFIDRFAGRKYTNIVGIKQSVE